MYNLLRLWGEASTAFLFIYQIDYGCDRIYLNYNKEGIWQQQKRQNVLQKPKKESNVRIPHPGNRNSVHLIRENSL